ncbi:hypothetical protein PVAP13_7NG108934 [Panicum virgatum]|uniref:Protein kinase domain-containing protein n=3 Tax=Panicum virgatum TaxID=38727 RepID=A0A8T0Q3M6_PANVG|nr:hypothetical protein PVAP13_7NG108934 [Panicum virgatum]KAG2564914.1 hypothetical protein PVAP13_7NG108934 [Panicum virgatum]
MADAMGSLKQIADAALAIKNAAETVRQNKEECRAIEKLVGRVSALVTKLKETETMNAPEMDGALEDLAESLNLSLKLVKSCQKRSIMCLFCFASDLSNQLRQARDDISAKMMLGVLATNIQFTVFFTRIRNIGSTPTQTYTHRYEVTGGEAHTAILPNGLARFSLLELKDATNNFSNNNIIGESSSSVVYKGVLRDGRLIAIKKLRVSPDHSTESIDDELSIVSKLEHKNIVKLLGYGHIARNSDKRSAEESLCFMVQEYMPNGSLEKIINGMRSGLNWSLRFQIIRGVACGLHYLHEQHIIHLDLKPSNILLDYYMSPKISDFGIAKMFEQSDHEFTTQNVVEGTMGYMAPEYIMDGRLTTMVDLYSFGTILLETISGMCKSKPKLRDLAAWAWGARQVGHRMKELFDPSLYDDDYQLKEIEKCLEIGLLCAQYDRGDRPTMAEVLEMLDGKRSLWAPKKPAYLR